MQNLSTLKSAFVAALIGTLFFMYARSGCAQPVSFSDASVEWTAAHSEVIVRAVIEEVSPHKYRNGLHRDTGINRFHTISIRVLETVKGPAANRLQFVHNGAIRHFRFLEARESQQEVLLFLDHWSRNPHFNRAYGEYAYTRFPLIVTHAAILKPDDSYWAHTDVPILSRDLTRLSNARQLVGTIKEFLDSREYDGPLCKMTIELPAELRGGFHRVDFTLPSDRTAEVPVLGFEAFKAEYARPKPNDQELSVYGRAGGGYVGVDSLELMAIGCDVIVRGVIEDSCFLGTDSNPAQGVKLRVLETLKGECATQIGVYTPYSPDVEQLQGDQQELVFFLTSQRLSIPAAALGYRTRGEVWDDAVIALDERKAEVLFADMSWHRQPMEILSSPKRCRSRTKEIPSSR